jgi:Malectin domain/Carbohydrate binding module (family 6)
MGFLASCLLTALFAPRVAHGFTSNYPAMYLRGAMNNWGTTAMTLVANNTWQVKVSLTASTAYQYKYDGSGAWTTGENWGVGSTPGVGAANAANINYTTGAAGNYGFQFNDSTLQYSVTPPGTTTTPGTGESSYGGSPAVIPGTVQAENYDTGGQGVAYNVTKVNGTDNGYRSDGVDLEVTTDTGGGVNLGWTAAGQWFRYTVNVATAGTYTVSFRVAAMAAVTDAFHLANSSGANLSGSVNVPATAGWQNWVTVTANVTLPAGQQVLTLDQDNAGWNLNYMSFATSGGGNTFTITASAGSGGSISPSGAVVVNQGANQAFTITPSSGYTVSSVMVDGAGVGAVTSYTFLNVQANHTISAAFLKQTSVPPNTAVLQINAGGGAVAPFVADTDYSAGNEFSSTATIMTSGVANAAPAAVYQDVRWNASFNYALPGLTPGASYIVRLHFVELSFTAAGQRVFNVAINGTTVLSNFDIFAQAGQNHALVEQFIATANGSGQIVVAFTQGSADNPSIAGIEVWTPAAIAAAPTGLSATGGNGQVNLIWNVSTGATSYNVYRGTSSGVESATPIATGVTGSNYTDSTVTNGTTYYYKVAAVNTGGTSGLSNEASALPKVVPPNAPTSPSATAGFGNVTLSWSASQGATSYTIYRGTSAGGEGSTPYATGITGTSFTDNNVTAGTTYYYTIVAVDSAGNSMASTEVSAAPLSVTGQGGSFPWTRYRAADSTVATYGGGATLETSPNFDKMNLATQASNQAYVQLSTTTAYVQWTVSQSNQAGVTMRFTLPDAGNGYGQNGSVDCYVNGTKVQTINLTSYYAWQYFGGGGDPSDTPVSGDVPAFAFDEVHWLLATPLQSGDVIRIQSSGGPVVGVDFIEIESVPAPVAQPAGSVSVASYGAVAYGNNSAAYGEIAELQGGSRVTTAPGVTDSLGAFNAAVAAALASPSKTLYIPAGTYYLSGMWVIGSTSSPISQLTIVGAGIWYTNIQFTNPNQAGGGCSIRLAATGTMNYSNVNLNSMLRSRDNENAIYKCFMDNFGVNSNFHDLWENHFECGFWVADYAYNPCQVAHGLTIQNCRIRNNLADGVNFCNGTYNSTVTNCNIRNGGDDGLAVWPNNFNSAPMAVNDTFTHNTIEFEWRSAGLALYGGSGHQVTYNLVEDTFMSAGFRSNSTFPGYQFQNNTGITISNDTFICCGTSYDAWAGELGAVDLEASNTSIRNFTFTNIQVIDAQRDGYSFGFAGGFSGMLFNSCSVDGTGLDGVTTSKYTQAHHGAGICTYGAGSATFKSMMWANCAGGNVFNQGGFVLTFQ